ncbi:hypothetical protein ABZP36_016786 [Zizania latifolia]
MEEEEWRELGLTVPASLVQVGTRTQALAWVDSAHRKLSVCANAIRMVRMGVSVADVADPAPAGVCPTVVLEGARRELVRLIELHGVAGHVFEVYGAHFGLQDDPRWQSWEGHRAEAVRHSAAALQRVCSVLSHTYAGIDAVRVARASLPRQSPPWNSWMSADEHDRRDQFLLGDELVYARYVDR